jgi:hypothetical protein
MLRLINNPYHKGETLRMAYQLKPVAELEKHFTITKVRGILEITEEEPVKVAFRQATEGESRKREDFISVPVTRSWSEESDFAQERYQLKPAGARRAYEVYLTLSACDILDAEENPLFKFSELNSVRRVAGGFEKFEARWGLLPNSLAIAIHEKCIEANPDWGFQWLSDEDAEGED